MASLYLLPVTLGSDWARCLPAYNREVMLPLRHFIVEDLRSARRFLRSVMRDFPIDDSSFYEMGKHADPARFSSLLQPLRQGSDMGIISEAGCPAVADPGADIVAIAQREGLSVVPLVGPNSMIMALMASGLNGQGFAFNGYLPIDDGERAKQIRKLEARSLAEHQTQLFIETPYRNHKLFQTLLANLRPTTRLCVAAGITTEAEWIRTKQVRQWKPSSLPDLSRTPAIFLIGE